LKRFKQLEEESIALKEKLVNKRAEEKAAKEAKKAGKSSLWGRGTATTQATAAEKPATREKEPPKPAPQKSATV